MTVLSPNDHLQIARWLRSEVDLPDEASLSRWMNGKRWATAVPRTLTQRWGWPTGGSWLHASMVQVMAMIQDEDLHGMAPAVHLVHALLGAGASPNVQDAQGRTPLHELFDRMPVRLDVGANWLGGMVRALLAAQADPRIPDRWGCSAPACRAARDAGIPWSLWWDGHPHPQVRACVAPVLERVHQLDHDALYEALNDVTVEPVPARSRL